MGAILMKMAVLVEGNALRPLENHDMESFPIGKTIIDRFSNRKCVLRWTAMDLEAISYLKINHLSIFQ